LPGDRVWVGDEEVGGDLGEREGDVGLGEFVDDLRSLTVHALLDEAKVVVRAEDVGVLLADSRRPGEVDALEGIDEGEIGVALVRLEVTLNGAAGVLG
jgi:hypothetical protein